MRRLIVGMMSSFLVIGLIGSSTCPAQDEPRDPPEGQRWVPPRLRPMPNEFQIDMEGLRMQSSQVVRIQQHGGTRTILATDNGMLLRIVEQPGLIEIRSTRQYTKEDAEELERHFPEVYMHLMGFPRESGGVEIQVKLQLTRVVEVADAEELREQHPDLYELYQKFSQDEAPVRPRLVPRQRHIDE